MPSPEWQGKGSVDGQSPTKNLVYEELLVSPSVSDQIRSVYEELRFLIGELQSGQDKLFRKISAAHAASLTDFKIEVANLRGILLAQTNGQEDVRNNDPPKIDSPECASGGAAISAVPIISAAAGEANEEDEAEHEFEGKTSGSGTIFTVKDVLRLSVKDVLRLSKVAANKKIVDMEKLDVELKTARSPSLRQRRWVAIHIFLDSLPLPDTAVARFVNSQAFFGFFMLAVVLNGVWTVVDTQNQMRDPVMHRQGQQVWLAVNGIFCFIFAVELLLKIVGFRRYFFGKDRQWNIFDAVVLVLSAALLFMPRMPYATFIRIARIFRIFRLVKLFSELRQMFVILYFSLSTLFWVAVLFLFLTFIFSLCLMQTTIDFIDNATSEQDLLKVAGVRRDYGNIYLSIVTVFHVLSGGDWYSAMAPLQQIWSGYKLVFAMFIFVMTFGVMNIIIGTFCEKAVGATDADRELRTQRTKESCEGFQIDMMNIFHEIDAHCVGSIDFEQFIAYAEKNEHFLRSCGIPTHDLFELFALIDRWDEDPDGTIDLASFVHSIDGLVGPARALDVCLLKEDVREIKDILKGRRPRKEYVLRKRSDDDIREAMSDISPVGPCRKQGCDCFADPTINNQGYCCNLHAMGFKRHGGLCKRKRIPQIIPQDEGSRHEVCG